MARPLGARNDRVRRGFDSPGGCLPGPVRPPRQVRADRHVTPAAPTTRVTRPSRYPDALRGQPREPRTERFGNATGGVDRSQQPGTGTRPSACVGRQCPTAPRRSLPRVPTPELQRRARPPHLFQNRYRCTPMATLTTSTETPTEYHERLCNATNGVDVMRWKALKGALYALGFAAFGAYAIQNGAQPLPTTVAVFVAGSAAMVGELREVEVANVLTLTFGNGKHRKAPDPGEED